MFHNSSYFIVVLLIHAIFIFSSVHCTLYKHKLHYQQEGFDRQKSAFSPKFENNHRQHIHLLSRAVTNICVDFNRQPIPCKWETEAQLRKKLLACHFSIITMPFCHRTVPKNMQKIQKMKSKRQRGGIFSL